MLTETAPSPTSGGLFSWLIYLAPQSDAARIFAIALVLIVIFTMTRGWASIASALRTGRISEVDVTNALRESARDEVLNARQELAEIREEMRAQRGEVKALTLRVNGLEIALSQAQSKLALAMQYISTLLTYIDHMGGRNDVPERPLGLD